MTKLLSTNLKLLLILSLAALVGCSSSPKKTGDGLVDAAAEAMSLELNGSSDENTAGPLQTIYFDFNSAQLTPVAKSTLEANAMWLKDNDEVTIQIEGHTDERGGHQYNLALGENRARVVQDYLVALGVSAANIAIISYGKEKPISYGHDEGSWSRNRRANFVVTAK